ncbi:MAG: molybdopterin/thiamine biosynthesis adenylyltransferase, partial [Gammaproteobacteria bacterium]
MDTGQLSRYSRQIKLPQIGETGQQKLLDSTALIIGMGGLGSPVAMYLAAAGVGHLVISDFDHVDESNLQRQI